MNHPPTAMGAVDHRLRHEWADIARRLRCTTQQSEELLQRVLSHDRDRLPGTLRDEMAWRMRQPRHGLVHSYPEVAKAIGFRSHCGARYAELRHASMAYVLVPNVVTVDGTGAE